MQIVWVITTATIAGIVGYFCGILLPLSSRPELETTSTILKDQLMQRSEELLIANTQITNLEDQVEEISKQLHEANTKISSLKDQLQRSSEQLNLQNNQPIREQQTNQQEATSHRPSSLKLEIITDLNLSKIAKYKTYQYAYAGNIRWKVLEVKDRGKVIPSTDSRHGGITDTLTTSGKFLEIIVEVVNLSTDVKNLTFLDLIDSKGREYAPIPSVNENENQELRSIDDLNPIEPGRFKNIAANE